MPARHGAACTQRKGRTHTPFPVDPYALQKYQAALPTRDKIPCTAALAGTPDRKNLQNGRVLIPVPQKNGRVLIPVRKVPTRL